MAPMLRLRRLSIDTNRENVAFLARNCPVYRPAEFQALNKIEIQQNGRRILAVLNIVDEPGMIAPDELGLAEQAFRQLGLPEGERVEIAPASPPQSLESVRRKIGGAQLTQAEITAIIQDIAASRYSKTEIAAFLIASARFLSADEVLNLTRAMADVGNRLSWADPVVVDKHCIGGIPGNRTSMIVVPIVAAHGLMMPKTSSRAITSAAGTADSMEVLARVDLGIAEMRNVVEKARGCLVWGGHVNLSPADDILISVERPLAIDTQEQLVASILSKKLAAGSTHLLVDIPVGPTAKVRSLAEAIRLRKLFEFVGDRVGLQVEIEFTDGRQPVGRGIGPVLEARDAMAVLANAHGAPQDLREKSLLLAGRIIDFDPALRGGGGHARAREILESGQALAAMERIIDGQGRNPARQVPGELTAEIPAPSGGWITAIDCFRIGRIARLAGAPMDKGAGIDLLAKLGDKVERGQPLYRIHACFQSDFRFACDLAADSSGYGIDDREPPRYGAGGAP
jgi:thymidine phosphorylase